jgi:hypothetical protein
MCSAILSGTVRVAIAAKAQHYRGFFVTLSYAGARPPGGCLCRGDASGVDDASDIPQCCGHLDERVDRLAGGHVYSRGAYLEPGIAKDLCRPIGGFLAQVSKQDVFACANPSRDCLTDRSSSDDDNDIFHGNFLC